jgi:hypothetical protein
MLKKLQLAVKTGGPLLRASRRIFPFIRQAFADSGYAGEKVAKATLIAVEIVHKDPDQVGFAVQPRHWETRPCLSLRNRYWLMRGARAPSCGAKPTRAA